MRSTIEILKISEKYEIQVINKQHYSLQLNNTKYFTYTELPTLINVHCIDKSGKEISVVSGNPKRIVRYNEITLNRLLSDD